MDDTLYKTLSLLGCNTLEIKIFISAFKLGPSKIPEIARNSHIKRSTAYLLIKNLIDRGLFMEDHKGYSNNVYTIDPDQLLKKLSNRQRIFRRQEIELEENIPTMRSLYQASEIHPKVRMYQGNLGLLAVWKDILSTKDKILLWTNQQTENNFFGEENHDKFIKERLSKNISIKVLTTNSEEGIKLQKLDKENLRETKILPRDTHFSAETYIYGNKVATLDYNKDIIGIITESKPIAEFHRSIFNQTWNLI